MSDSGALFIRLATPTSSPSVICMLPAVPGTEGLRFEAPADKCVLKDGPKGTKEEVAIAIDPRAIYRPMMMNILFFIRHCGTERGAHRFLPLKHQACCQVGNGLRILCLTQTIAVQHYGFQRMKTTQ